ncbi:Reticulon-4 [Stylophora pistillata]|uniref:Reticulon-like protein n=2 Tax=Stylophora pistillata TaxID=50429 RepID=A0A2B4S7J6_STYPI|nr:Reticulon-4 [Stylophora pistillata]
MRSIDSPRPVMDVKDILLWRDVKVTAIVFVSGFVLLICLTQFSVVSVLTNIALVCLAPMLALRLLLTARSAFLRTEFEHPLKAYLSKDIEVSKDKADFVGEKVSGFAVAMSTKLRALFLVDDLADSLKLLIALYVISYVAQWFSGITLTFIAFIGAFTIPKIYDMYGTEINSCLGKIKSAVEDATGKITSKVPKGTKNPADKETQEENDNDKKVS